MLSDNDSDHRVGSLIEVIREAENDPPSIDIVAICGLGRDPRRSSVTDTSNDHKINYLLDDLHKQISTRLIQFNPIVLDGIDPFSSKSVTRNAELLLSELSYLRDEEDEIREIPIAFIAHGFGGVIIKKALVMAESNATYCNISQNCSQLVFFEMPHRAHNSTGWDDLLLNTLLSSPLPLPLPWNMLARIRSFSTFLEGLSAKFISLRMRRSITNICQLGEDSKDAGHQMIHRYSFTTGLVYETNIPETSKHENISRLPIDEYDVSAIVSGLKAETNSQYRACLSRLFEISPLLIIPDDQVYMPGQNAELIIYNDWLESRSSCIITTSGGRGVGKSLKAGALFRKLRKPSNLVAYFSFSETDATRDSFKSFLSSVTFQVLAQDPERFSRVEGLFAAMELSNTWTEASLLVLFQSLLDTTDGSGPLHLVIDDLQNCDSPRDLVKALTAVVSNKNSPTKLKVALFYDWPGHGGDGILEDILRDCNEYRIHGPVLTQSMHKPLVTYIVDQVISNRPYLFNFRSQLSDALEKCKNTTEILLAVQSIDTSNPGPTPRTLKSLELLITNPQPSISDVVNSRFELLPGWGRTMLGWIIHCKRPLMLDELATAVTLTNNEAKFSSFFDPKLLAVDFAADIRSVLGPLVRFEGGGVIFSDRVVRNQFLSLIAEERVKPRKKRLLKPRIPGDADIAGILFEYLSWQDFVDPVNIALQAKSAEFIQPPGELFDLITYAVQYLPFHYQACKDNNGLPNFAQNSQFILTWPKLNSRLNSTASPSHIYVADSLFLAAQLGLTGMIKLLKESVKGTRRETAISLASWGGHADTVLELLVGECVDHTEKVDTTTALNYASARGYDEIIGDIVSYMKEMRDQNLPLLFDQLLCKAAELGYKEQVSLWIELGANVNAAPDSITPLQYATRNGHASLVDYLLVKKRADVYSKAGSNVDEPILLAARGGYKLIVQYLLAAAADITCLTKDKTKRTPLYLAAEYGHEEVVRLLLAEKPERYMVNHQNLSGNSPLIVACMKGHGKIVDMLLRAGASVTLCNEEGRTALYYALGLANEDLAMTILTLTESAIDFKDINDVFLRAAELGFERVISHCLERITPEKADELVQHSNYEHRKALHLASMNGYNQIAKNLIEAGAEVDPRDTNGLTPLALAAEAGETYIVHLLLGHLANACLQVYNDQTILYRVASQPRDSTQHAAVVSLLLDTTDIDPNEMGGDRKTALHSAVSLGHLEITKALLRHPRIDPNVAGRWHWNALHFLGAHENKSTKKIAELLIEAGTDPLGLDIDSWCPIHVASQSTNIPALEVLLKHNPECLEAKTDDGRTALLFGLHSVECVKWLMDYGADGNTRDDVGRTPLMIAAGMASHSSVRMLLNYECDASLVQGDGRTALHFAASSGSRRTGQILLKKHIEILSVRDITNLSALHCAIREQRTVFASFLLDEVYPKIDEGARLNDVNAVEAENGETPLISAIKEDEVEVSCQLLRLGAKTEHRDKSGYTALLAVISSNHSDRLKMLHALLNPQAPNRADVNAGGGAHETALHRAAKYGKMEFCKELIKSVARVDTQGGQFNTALNAAASNGYYDVAIYLLEEQKADPNLPAGNFANALSAAIDSQTYNLVTPLLKAGVDIEATDIQGRTAFHIATRQGSWEVLEKLLKANKEKPPTIDKQGRTLLHYAAMSGDQNTFLRVLADETMDWDDIDVEDVDGWTPLHWACRQNENRIIAGHLEEYGADFTKTTKDGWTPENIAIYHDATEMVSYIQGVLAEKSIARRWKVGRMHHITCDGCQLDPIYGVQWHCEDCFDFDFCFKCYWTAKETHYEGHKFTARPKEANIGRAPECEDDSDQESDGPDPDEAESEENDEDKDKDYVTYKPWLRARS